jgi:catechol 2,3-dioxygenase-like lactoylglutathione lyase family enzyme
LKPNTLDHVALWVADRDTIADFVTAHVGMHVIDRTDRFTLVGADARRGKLTLFAADGPRDPGALRHVALRVSDLAQAEAELPSGLALDTRREGELYFDVAEGLRLGLVEAPTDSEYDLDHVALRASDPGRVAHEYLRLGFAEAPPSSNGHPRVTVGGAYVELVPGGTGSEPERPLLNHLAVLVDSADEEIAAAEELGLEIADVVDAANTYAVFVWGPDGVKVEYVEHKPSFSLT